MVSTWCVLLSTRCDSVLTRCDRRRQKCRRASGQSAALLLHPIECGWPPHTNGHFRYKIQRFPRPTNHDRPHPTQLGRSAGRVLNGCYRSGPVFPTGSRRQRSWRGLVCAMPVRSHCDFCGIEVPSRLPAREKESSPVGFKRTTLRLCPISLISCCPDDLFRTRRGTPTIRGLGLTTSMDVRGKRGPLCHS